MSYTESIDSRGVIDVYRAAIGRYQDMAATRELTAEERRSLGVVERRLAKCTGEETRVTVDPYADDFYARDDAPPKPYGDVKYGDPKNGKYPLDTKKHVKAAWAFINEPQNAAKYPMNGVTLSSVKNNIIAAAKQFGVNIAADSGSDGRSVLMAFDVDDPNRPLNDAEARELLARMDAARIRKHERIGREMGDDSHVPSRWQRRDMRKGLAHAQSIGDYRSNRGW